MENFKSNLDRPKIEPEEIASKQNFNNVLSKFNQAKVPVYKNPWFWGSAGLASLGITTVLSLNALTTKKEIDDKIITSTNTQLPKDTECIKPPIKDESINALTFQVDSRKDEKIVLKSGTVIEIEKGSLEAKDPTRKVAIEIREFRDQSSVFIAGIPMDYQKSAFESAGMIEIVGKQNGEEVKINPSKPIEVSLKTTKNPEDFKFWNLNQEKKTWEEYPSSIQSIPNKNASNSVEKIKSTIIEVDKKIEVVSKEISNLEKPKSETYKIPSENAQKFDLDFDKNEYPELASFKNVVFEVIGNDPTFNTNSSKVWPEIDLQKNKDKYTVIFRNSKETYKVNVRPTLAGSELKSAEKEFDNAFKSFKETKSNLEKKKEDLISQNVKNQTALNDLIKKQLIDQDTRLANRRNQIDEISLREQNNLKIAREKAQVSDFSNTVNFQTTRWGVFNCDKAIAYPEPLATGVALLWVGNQIAKFKQIFVFNLDKNTRYTYGDGFQSIDNFGLHKNDTFVIVGIDFDSNVGYVELKDPKAIKNINKIIFEKKDKSTKTVDLLKKILNETTVTA